MGIAGTFLFMIVIGAAIGAVTNHLAIQMLFRPYRSITCSENGFRLRRG